jgi:hypothetical protein
MTTTAREPIQALLQGKQAQTPDKAAESMVPLDKPVKTQDNRRRTPAVANVRLDQILFFYMYVFSPLYLFAGGWFYVMKA